MKYLLMFLVLACILAFAYNHYQERLSSAPPRPPPPVQVVADAPTPSTADSWRPPPRNDSHTAAQASASGCDGRTHCSQMRSCADAKTQMRCPGAAMDGEGDGIPCESQWCQ